MVLLLTMVNEMFLYRSLVVDDGDIFYIYPRRIYHPLNFSSQLMRECWFCWLLFVAKLQFWQITYKKG